MVQPVENVGNLLGWLDKVFVHFGESPKNVGFKCTINVPWHLNIQTCSGEPCTCSWTWQSPTAGGGGTQSTKGVVRSRPDFTWMIAIIVVETWVIWLDLAQSFSWWHADQKAECSSQCQFNKWICSRVSWLDLTQSFFSWRYTIHKLS